MHVVQNRVPPSRALGGGDRQQTPDNATVSTTNQPQETINASRSFRWQDEEPRQMRWREVSPDVFYTDSFPVRATEADLRLLRGQGSDQYAWASATLRSSEPRRGASRDVDLPVAGNLHPPPSAFQT